MLDNPRFPGEHVYPSIGPGVRLHRQPSGVVARVPPPISKATQPSSYEFKQEAADILLLCDGTKSFEEIFSSSLKKLDFGKHNPSAWVTSFIEDAVSIGAIKLHDRPQSSKLHITGSSEYHSPSHFAIELTDACNLKCLHCYRDSGFKGQRLPLSLLFNILDGMSQNGVSTVELTGGEPTFHPLFRKIIERCSKLFSTVSIITNGWFVDEDLGAFFGKYRKKVFVQVDLDGDSAAAHDGLRGVSGSFVRAQRAIRVLVKNKVRVRVAMNAYPGNWDRVQQTFDLARRFRADWFAVAPLMTIGRGITAKPLTPSQMNVIGTVAEDLSRRYPKIFFVSHELERVIRGEKRNCGAGSRSMVLDPTGKVRPCLLLPSERFQMGDLTKLSYEEFLQLAPIKYFYGLSAPTENLCLGCKSEQFCKGCFVGPVFALDQASRKRESMHCRWKTANAEFFEFASPP